MPMRITGFSPIVRKQVKERAGLEGDYVRCEMCGRFDKYVQLHHRRPRGRGGSRLPETNQAANCAALCMADHAWCEENRLEARKRGFIIPQFKIPQEVPIQLWDGWHLLDNDGMRYSMTESDSAPTTLPLVDWPFEVEEDGEEEESDARLGWRTI